MHVRATAACRSTPPLSGVLLVWDEKRRYIATNEAACKILGTTLDELLGQPVGEHTSGGTDAAEAALGNGLVAGEAVAERFDGAALSESSMRPSRPGTAGMPFMATLLARQPA